MISKKIKALFITTLVVLTQLAPAALADFLPVQAYATDTVAGYPSLLQTSLIDQNQQVSFVVGKPDGAVIQIPAQADLDGVAKADFFGHHTKIAGEYHASVVFPASSTSSPQSTFTVYPDEVSPTQSTLHSTIQMVEAGMDSTFVVVTLFDQYRNPISNHHVNLISSRSEDTIDVLQSGVTDENGQASFRVNSAFPGISVFTAMDVTANQVLEDRDEVVFFAPAAPKVTSNPFAASLFAADIGQGSSDVLPGPVDHFDIEGIPSTVKVGEELSMTVVARDKNGNVAKNYTGTILISVPDDDNAILPNNGEYTFKASDQGQFTFALSLQFSKIGSQAVQVFDKNNFKFFGEHPVEIISTGPFVPGPSSSSLKIMSPADGSELSTNLIILTGKGNDNINLKVFDNDIKIGDTETDSDGFFSFEVKNLDSGSHTFYVMSESNEVSAPTTLQIDTLAPVLYLFEIFPEGSVLPGSEVEITVQTEPGLEEAKVRIQGVEEMLMESGSEPGTYSATLIAPVTDGSFPVDVILVDSLTNKAEFSGKGVIQIQTPQVANPPKVEGLEGEPADASVQLTWNAIKDHERPVQHYRVYYGTLLDTLDQTVDTADSSTTWELRGLNNNSQYFIAVKAIDTQGLESDDFSVTIAVTPVAPDPCFAVDCGDYGTCNEGVCECSDDFSGDRCETEPAPVPVDTGIYVQATPQNSAVLLTWNPYINSRTYRYKVFMGFYPGQYVDSLVTQDNRTTVVVQDLINNVPYYVAVAALDINGSPISPLSQEVQVIPSGLGFRPSAPSPIPYDTSGYAQLPDQDIYRNQLDRLPRTDDTGPEAIWVVFASLVFAHFLYHHKRKIILKNQND